MAATAPDKRKAAQQAARRARKMASDLEAAVGIQSNADRMRELRAAAKLIHIPRCDDHERRTLLEYDDAEWMRYYFDEEACPKDPFSYAFVPQQLAMIAAIRTAIIEGGDQAIAAPRGEGKTSLFERMLMKYTLQGLVKFSVLFAATGMLAEGSLDSIKEQLEANDRLLLDYPEVCYPVRCLENTPNRAHYQIANGFRHDTGEPYEAAQTHFGWSGQEITFPNVPGSPSAQAIIATRGLDSAVRGIKRKGRRVDVACIDDPDTEETARSPEQAKKLIDRIDRGIAGLGSQKRNVARIVLSTTQSKISASWVLTDLESKPNFHGQRFKFLVQPPEREDLWKEYIVLRHDDWRAGTARAGEFYRDRFKEMNEGAIVGNVNRFVTGELSAVQHFYNLIAKLGPDAVATEYQNDPPDETGLADSGMTPGLVMSQVSGLKRGVIPEGCVLLTHGVDVGKWKLHWVVRAWLPNGTGYTIDYGIQQVHGAKFGAKETDGLDRAIHREVLRRVDEFRSANYQFEDGGGTIADSITTIDAGYRTHAIYAACAEAGNGVYPIMGFGKSAGCCGVSWTPANKRTPDICSYGEDWKIKKAIGRVRLIECSADKWKSWEHDRWQTAVDRPGCMFIFGEHEEMQSSEERRKGMSHGHEHKVYADQICAEAEVEEMVRGMMIRKWRNLSKENHYLDASYYSCVGASVRGIKIQMAGSAVSRASGAVPAAAVSGARKRMTFDEMKKARA